MMYFIIYALAMASTALAVLLGCAVEDPKLGQEMLPLLFVPQMLFAGFFVRPELIPQFLRWAQYLCTLTFAVRILLVAEFNGCSEDKNDCYRSHNPEAASLTSRALLDGANANPDEIWWNWLVLIALFVVFRIGALYVLKSKATKFY
jgi:ABC-type multidrug transport system permease subunit